MKLRVLTAALIVLALCVPVCAVAAGKSTVDPNAGGSATPGDGLTQKVTYEARRKTVLSVVTDLSKMTGVTLKAGRNTEDWQVRDRKINVFAKDISLADLMSSIARVTKLKWAKSGSGDPVSYRLHMDDKTLLAAQSNELAEDERVKKRQTARRQKLLSELEAASSMSDADLEKLKTDSPYVYSIAQSGRATRFLPRLFKEVPGAKEKFLSGEDLTVDFDGLSTDLQKALWGGFKLGEGKGDIRISGVNSPGAYACIAKVTIAYADDPEQKGIASRLQSLSCSLSDPDSEVANLMTSLFAAGPVDKARLVELSKMDEQAFASEMKDIGEPLAENPDDPALLAKVKIKPDGDSFADALAALAKASGMSVVSDSFAQRMPWLTFPSEETDLRTALAKLESTYCRYNWEKHGSTLELRNRDWCKKLAAMIPEASIERWRKAFVKNGLLDLSELSQIAVLTDGQISANLSQDEVLSQASLMGFGQGMESRDLLTAYAAMSKQQQRLIFTKHGLSLDMLADSQSPAVQALWRRCSALQSASGLVLTGKREVKDGHTYYDFNATKPGGGFVGPRWIVRCPSYKVPATTAGPADGKKADRGTRVP